MIAEKRPSSRVGLAYAAIEERIRTLPPGRTLPTMPELRRELSVSQLTLERAYEALEARGLIERKKGRGVYVADRLQTGEFAIVVRPALIGAHSHPYYRSLSQSLIEWLQSENPAWQVRMHVGKHTPSDEQFPATLDLLDPAVLPRLRGVFSLHALHELGPRLEQTGVPLLYVGNPRGRNSVALDKDGMLAQGLQHLRDVGCTSVGLIAHSLPVGSKIVETFLGEAAARGLAADRGWVEQTRDDPSERAGYEAFLRFWSNQRRPEAIFVQDDYMCNGVLRATLHLGLHLPRDLRLVTFANRGVEQAYHLPVSRVEFDCHELARTAVDVMVAMVHGRAVPKLPIQIGGRMIKGETT